MIVLYQIFNGGVNLSPDVFFTLAPYRSTRGHPFKLQKPRAESRVRRNALSVRTVNDWNALPSSIVCSSTLNMFKSNLDAYWSSIMFDIPIQD